MQEKSTSQILDQIREYYQNTPNLDKDWKDIAYSELSKVINQKRKKYMETRKQNISSRFNVEASEEDFTYYDFTPKNRGPLSDSQCILRFLKYSGQIRMNQTVSTVLYEKGFHYVRIRVDNLTGDMCLVFNKSNGVKASFSMRDLKRGGCAIAAIFSCKEMVKFIIEKLRLDEAVNIKLDLHGNISNSEDCLVYKIINPK